MRSSRPWSGLQAGVGDAACTGLQACACPACFPGACPGPLSPVRQSQPWDPWQAWSLILESGDSTHIWLCLCLLGWPWARLVLAVTKHPLRLDPAPLLLQPQAPDHHHLVPTERLAGREPDHPGLGLHGVRTRRYHWWVPAAPSEPPAPRPLPLPPGPGRVASRVAEAQGRSWRSQPPVSPPDLPGHQPLRKAGAGGSRPTPSVH